MDFTREPIIETVITPKEGCKIVVRSSKNVGQEEYFVDALEVVSFGNAMFFRSLEKPKAFLVPVSDYEILEVREARMVLKNVGLDRSIKIGGGREAKAIKEPSAEKVGSFEGEAPLTPAEEQISAAEGRPEKKRDRRRQQRRRRGREEVVKEDLTAVEISQVAEEVRTPVEAAVSNGESKGSEGAPSQVTTTTFISSLLPPPPTLISETIGRYKENVLFKNAFYTKEEVEAAKIEGKKEETKQEQEEPSTSNHYPSEGEQSPPFASFWDDMNEPMTPPIPLIEEEKTPPAEEKEEDRE